MQQRSIGPVSVGAIGLGAMHFSFSQERDDARSVRTVHAAIDAGVTLIDTALCYTTTDFRRTNDLGILESHSESIVAAALRDHPKRDDVLVATKGGHYREGDGFPKDGRPESIKAHCEISLRTLGVEAIGLYQLHWPDPDVPIAESMGAFADLQREGKVRLVGGSNFSVAQIEEARTVCDLVSMQNHFSPHVPGDTDVIQHCAAADIAYLPWSPLGGARLAKGTGAELPAFQDVADAHGVTVQQVVLAWHLAVAPNVIPIPGTKRPEAIVECAAAASLTLAGDELAVLDAAVRGDSGAAST